MFKKILSYLVYPSTWKGIITGLTLLGIQLAPEQSAAITNAGVALVACVWTFFSDTDVA